MAPRDGLEPPTLKMSANAYPALAVVSGTGILTLVLATLAGESSVRSLSDESCNVILIKAVIAIKNNN
jgi:hypothetical protein